MERRIRTEAPDAGRILENLMAVRASIAAACERAGRQRDTVRLLPVVKYVDSIAVHLLAGIEHRGYPPIRDFAENTLQGTESMMAAFAGPRPKLKSYYLGPQPILEGLALRWHLIGHLQRNKARKAVSMFSSIHSLDSERLARKLEEELEVLERAPADPNAPTSIRGPHPRLFVEVNIARERRKSGLDPDAVPALLAVLKSLPRVSARLDGLMAMAPHSEDPEASRPHFRRLRELRDDLAARGLLPAGAELSMGMSADFEVAVEEGAAVVRVGSRLFEGMLASRGEEAR